MTDEKLALLEHVTYIDKKVLKMTKNIATNEKM